MKCNPEAVIKVAESQIGYHEKASNSQLDDFTANSGSNNWNKYARDIDEKYPDFYNGKNTLAAAKVFTKDSAPQPSGKVVKASQSAQSFKESLAGEYKVNASSGLNLRDGAGTNYRVLCTLPYGQKVENYGYYTDNGGIRWLYVSTILSGTEYIGFVSSQWLN